MSCISPVRLLPVRLAQEFRPIYRFLLNKWYFDELYDAHLRPARHPPGSRCSGRSAMSRSSTACRTALAELTGGGSRQVGEDPDRLARGLCFRHADRRRRAGRHLHAVPVRSALCNAAGFPILSLITWLPLVGCLVIMMVRGDEATVASNARWTALWTSLLVFVAVAGAVGAVRPSRGGLPVRSSASTWLPEYRVGYSMGVDGISVLFVLLSTAADADLHPGELGGHPDPRPRVHARAS